MILVTINVRHVNDKKGKASYFIVHTSYIDSKGCNKSIFYPALIGEVFRIAGSFFLYKDFKEKAIELLNRMKAQGVEPLRCRKALYKIIGRHEKTFANFRKSCDETLSKLHI